MIYKENVIDSWLKAKFHWSNPTRLDRTWPYLSPRSVSNHVFDLVYNMSGLTSETLSLWDTCHMTENRSGQTWLLGKMADEIEIIVEACSVITATRSLGAAILLLKKKR